MDALIDKTRKHLGVLTIFSSFLYLIIVVYCFVALYIAYVIRKEDCPMGFMILPTLAWPALFIFWIKFYAGLEFLKKKFGFKKFMKYLICILLVESLVLLFWYNSKIITNKLFLISSTLSCLLYIYCLIFITLRKKELFQSEESDTFYLGISLIQATDIFLGTIFAILLIPQCFDFKTMWIKNFTLDANIFNAGKQIGMTCLIFIYFWNAFNIKKFTLLARKVQLNTSSLSIVEIFTGSLFFSFLPVHIFSIMYLNAKNIKNLFDANYAKKKPLLLEKAMLPILSMILLVVIVAWLYQYSWQFGFKRFGINWKNKNYRSVEIAQSEQLSKLSDGEMDSLIKATDLYSEGKYKDALEILNGVAYKFELAPFYKMILASCYGQLGDIEKAKSIGDEVVGFFTDNNATNNYNLACYYSIIKEKNKSIQYLRRSIELDRAYINQARNDKDFNNIKDSPEFKALIENNRVKE